MVDSIVSVRMPSSLVQKLKSLSKDNHFLDVSEEMRSIIRSKIDEHKQGKLTTRTQRADQIKSKAIVEKKESREELVKKLKEIIRELENE